MPLELKINKGRVIKSVVGLAAVGGLAGWIYLGLPPLNVSATISDKDKCECFEHIYTRALFQYADTNHDGIISSAEQDEFDRLLLKDKGVTMIHNQMPKYKDGSDVPRSVIVDWIKNYQPKK